MTGDSLKWSRYPGREYGRKTEVKLGQAGCVVGVSEGRLPEGHLSLLPFSDYGFHWDFATNDIEISV